MATSPSASEQTLSHELVLASSVECVDFISDLHLQATEPRTFDAWSAYMQSTQCQALCVLGDLFEVWVGDDALDDPGQGPFWQDCADVIRSAAQRFPVFYMPGNRDFLLGERFLALSNMQLLADPTTLVWGQHRWLLSHGDELCLGDTRYQQFRKTVRNATWKSHFLEQTLQTRIALAKEIRTESKANKLQQSEWADVDEAAAQAWLNACDANVLIHGHTHQPATHHMPSGATRWVLSDWDAAATPPRLQVLRVQGNDQQFDRIDLTGTQR